MSKPLLTIDDYEEAARRTLPLTAFDYFRSGANEEQTLLGNRKSFRNYEIWPRVLVDVSEVDTSVTICGTGIAFPILVAPTAYQKMAHPDGESGAARGAAAAGTIYTLSTLATTTIEDVAAGSIGPKWFQLYVHTDRGLTKALVERAQKAGYLAIVLTVDAPVLGRRLSDERNRFVLPEGLSMVNMGELADDISSAQEGSALTSYVATRHDATLQWKDIEWLRSITSLKILIKGILRPDDALRAVERGVDGIVVSNHGGRQLDSAPATIDALPGVADAVSGRCEVLLDSGIRFGTDVLKAIALGAKAVLVGRPAVWGLAVGGADGVQRILEMLRDELVTAMALSGCATISSIDPSLVRPAARA